MKKLTHGIFLILAALSLCLFAGCADGPAGTVDSEFDFGDENGSGGGSTGGGSSSIVSGDEVVNLSVRFSHEYIGAIKLSTFAIMDTAIWAYKLEPDEEISSGYNSGWKIKKGTAVLTVTQVPPLYEVDKIEIEEFKDSEDGYGSVFTTATKTSDGTYTFTVDETPLYVNIDVIFKSTLKDNIKDGTLTASGKDLSNYWGEYIIDDIRALDDSTTLTTIDFSGVTGLTEFGDDSNYGEHSFKDLTSLKSVIFPSGITEIVSYMFRGCPALESVTLPSTLTKIGSEAFYNCTSLASITIPEGVTEIGREAFKGCTSLESVTLPSTLTSIESSAFEGCTALVSITIPEGVTEIGYDAFSGCTALESITLPSTLTKIESSAFYNCTSLASITIPEGVTKIGREAFKGCTSLESVTLPSTLTSIESSAFEGCTALKEITIPASVSLIGKKAFSESALTSATFADTTTEWYKTDQDNYWDRVFIDSNKIGAMGATATENATKLTDTYKGYYLYNANYGKD